MSLNVKELRKKHGLSQDKLAQQTGIPKGRINGWEQKGAKPKHDDMIILERFFNGLEKKVSQTDADLAAFYKDLIEGNSEYFLVPKIVVALQKDREMDMKDTINKLISKIGSP